MKNIQTSLNEHIYPVLPPHIARLIAALPGSMLNKVTEIRIRADQPLQLVLGSQDITVQTEHKTRLYQCTSEDVNRTFQLICKNSVYAFEEEVRQGYLTIAGGHRVGLTGQAITMEGTVRTLKHINSLNIRLAREITGCADRILPFVTAKEHNEVFSTLIISPPRCGKTTILRDLIRQLSTGNPLLGIAGVQIGVVDERSEIAACQQGIPTVDLGPRVDVLDACPKASGLLMLIRSMAPYIVATDELGRREDALAVREAVCAGVKVLATAHSRTIAEFQQRPYVGELIQEQVFERYIILSNRSGPGTIEEILDSRHKKAIGACLNEVNVCG
ncbi:stage III sporulation protein AA [Sporomusa termitida]|uniref:Stage III sporulation protein AA n=1 Tax=Sporomusa termitida TaxID=2377 RepID=A0A517DTX7_9FIRM|nr:stage III sporulation protein AA [Sporomusa termitida]QDR80814.1 stage III sporulation protein AA [Sporomusa termitida]